MRGKIFYKEVFLRLPCVRPFFLHLCPCVCLIMVSLWCCWWLYNNYTKLMKCLSVLICVYVCARQRQRQIMCVCVCVWNKERKKNLDLNNISSVLGVTLIWIRWWESSSGVVRSVESLIRKHYSQVHSDLKWKYLSWSCLCVKRYVWKFLVLINNTWNHITEWKHIVILKLDDWLIGSWLVVWVLWHIKLCRLFNAKSNFMQIVSSISNNSF